MERINKMNNKIIILIHIHIISFTIRETAGREDMDVDMKGN